LKRNWKALLVAASRRSPLHLARFGRLPRLEVTGKGNKTRLVPASDELVAELARYRRAPAWRRPRSLGKRARWCCR